MSAPAPGPPEIRDYLLRRMSEAARARFEEAYFRDDRLLDRIENEEDRLVADYVMGRLAEPERHLFEESLLESPYYRDRVETTRGIKLRLAEERFFRRTAAVGPPSDPHGLDSRLFPRGTGVAVAFALLILVSVASLVSAYFLKSALATARQRASEAAPDPGTASQAGVVPVAQTVVVAPEKVTGPSITRIRRPAGGSLLLVLPQAAGAPRGSSLGVALARGTRVFWDSGDVPARDADAGAFSLRLPPGVPPAGNYGVRLRVRGAGLPEDAFLGTLDIREP